MKKNLFAVSATLNYSSILSKGAKKNSAVFILLFFFSLHCKAQLFTGGGGAIQNNGVETYFNLPVSGLSPAQIDSVHGIEQVCITIAHTSLTELYVSLQSPSGTIVELSAGFSSSGTNYTNTCFDSQAATSVTLGSAPYSGVYKPIGYIGRFNTAQTGNGTWKLMVKDFLPSLDSGTVISWSITFGNSPPHPVLLTSSNLPLVIINTSGQTLTDNEITADMGIISNGAARNYITDPFNNYNNKIAINIRGSSSKIWEKKSYHVETRNLAGAEINFPILGMPAESDWDLIAPYQDKSLVRVSLSYDLFRQMGHYAPRVKNAEVIINNEYRGIYLVAEKPKRGANRIDISKLTPLDNSFPDVTGGYIIKIDRTDEAGWFSLLPGNSGAPTHFYYQYVYPKDTAITTTQKIYIKSVLDSFETVMNAPNFADPVTGYQKFIDVNSFVDFFIINELSKNVDAYRLSTYLFKEKSTQGGKIHIGPVWDYDIAWHNCNYGNSFDPTGWGYQLPDTTYPSPTWWARFMQDSNFVNKLNCRWNSLRQNLLNDNYTFGYIDSTVNTLNEAMQRNFIQWPVLGANIFPNPQNQNGATYSGEITDLKNWITSRAAWLDANIPGTCIVGIQENELSGNLLRAYPNPFNSNLNISYKIYENANVKTELLNLLGDQVLLHFNGNKTAGAYTEEISTAQLAAGIYIIRLSVNNHVYHQKLIKADY
ncbi:MAG: CotH kinase family protein [Bacteroidia bacterium]|nr:CotH kinase family protein [Bacteroidia bacterium]